MIYIIGVSYSIEYAIKGLYENTIGRVFEWIRGEDAHAARRLRAQGAAGLCRVSLHRPLVQISVPRKARWLDGDFGADAESPLRTWERDFALGTEYFVKIGYAALIQKALDAGSDDEPRDIMFVVATLPPEVLAKEPRIKPIRALTPQWQLVQTPRYKDLTEILHSLLDQGFGLAEIAGNHEILITVIAPKAAKLDVKEPRSCFRWISTPNPASAGPA